MKTKEQIAKYNKKYFARPEVIAWAKIRNVERRDKRKVYKQTSAGKRANKKYQQTEKYKLRNEKYRLQKLYGITPEIYQKMIEKSEGKCAICEKETDKFHIDHCHKTNKVRGLLCCSCNLALGLFKDDLEILKKAIKYLYGN